MAAQEIVSGERRMLRYQLAPFDYFTVGEIVGEDVILRLDDGETTVRSKLWVRLWSRVVR